MNRNEISNLINEINKIDQSHERTRRDSGLHWNDLERVDLKPLEGARATYYQYNPKTRNTDKYPALIRNASFDMITEGAEDDPNVRRVTKILLQAIVSFPNNKNACLTGYVRNGPASPAFFELLGDDEISTDVKDKKGK